MRNDSREKRRARSRKKRFKPKKHRLKGFEFPGEGPLMDRKLRYFYMPAIEDAFREGESVLGRLMSVGVEDEE